MTPEQEALLLANLHIPDLVIARFAPHLRHDQDFKQECLLQMVQATPGFSGRAKASTYYYKVCRNTLRKYLSRPTLRTCPLERARNVPDEDSLDSAAPLDFTGLSPQERRILSAVVECNYSVAAAADQLGIPRRQFQELARQAASKLQL